MSNDCRGPHLVDLYISHATSCHITAARLLKNCKPALIPSSIAEVRKSHSIPEMQGPDVFYIRRDPISSTETEVFVSWKLNIYYDYYAFPRFIVGIIVIPINCRYYCNPYKWPTIDG